MRIVLSGAAGFIGSHFCDRSLAEGHTVVGLDNFLTGSPQNIQHLAGEARFRFIEQDITDEFSIDGPVDCVVNMASPASPKDYLEHPIETLEVGSRGTQRMLELVVGRGSEQFRNRRSAAVWTWRCNWLLPLRARSSEWRPSACGITSA